jgi:hypothetical protein
MAPGGKGCPLPPRRFHCRMLSRRKTTALAVARRHDSRHALAAWIEGPPGAPAAFRDRGALWRAVDAAERRRDAQLARVITASLPQPVPWSALRQYVHEQFVCRGMVADAAVFPPARPGAAPRLHLMLTTRALGATGFGKKRRDWNDRRLLLQWRSGWKALWDVAAPVPLSAAPPVRARPASGLARVLRVLGTVLGRRRVD